MLDVKVILESAPFLAEYGKVPISFRVESRYRVEPIQSGLGGLALVEVPVRPYVKDYDSLASEGPRHWAERWDIANWGILSAYDGAQRVGGAAMAWKTAGLNLLAERDDLAVLWDLRVRPDCRGRGVGHRLFAHALAWARARRCREIMVETQNINVPACRFYARQGCELGAINRNAYEDAPDEIQLLWYRKV